MKKFLTDEEMAAAEMFEKKPSPKDPGVPKFISDEEMAGMESESVDKPWYSVSGKGLLKSTAEALPAAGAIGGGLIGLVGGPAGGLVGAGLGGALGKASENLIEKWLLDEEKTRQQIYGEPVIEGVKSAAMQGAGDVIAKGAGLVMGPVGKSLAKYDKTPKLNAENIADAGKRLGIDLPDSFTTVNPVISDLEQTVAQSPSFLGRGKREQFEQAFQGLRSGVEKAAKSGSQFESLADAGDVVKAGLRGGVKAKIAPAKQLYKEVAETGIEAVPLSVSARQSLIERIGKIPEITAVEGTTANAIGKQIVKSVANAKNIRDMNLINSSVKTMLRDRNMSPLDRRALSQVSEMLDITNASLYKGSARKMATGGQAEALKTLDKLKEANTIYAKTNKNVVKLSNRLGIGKAKNHQDFLRLLDETPSEKVADKVFKLNDSEAVSLLKKEFPNEFETLRSTKISSLYDKAVTAKGELSLPNFLRSFDKIDAKTKKLLFDPKSLKRLEDVKTVYAAIPEKLGPSGTPKGLRAAGGFTDEMIETVRDVVRLAKLNQPEVFSKVGKNLSYKGAQMRGIRPGFDREMFVGGKLFRPAQNPPLNRGFLRQTVGRGLLKDEE